MKDFFGLNDKKNKKSPKEQGVVDMAMDVFQNFAKPLSHEVLWQWHSMLMQDRSDLETIGAYRTHPEDIQILSGYSGHLKVHFTAPPSSMVYQEMDRFIKWFNDSSPYGKFPMSPLIRASIAHLYFESIHPFEDGNGRIGRSIVEKALSQHLNHLALLSLSDMITKSKKSYYDALEKQNKHNSIDFWLEYFTALLLDSQNLSLKKIEFILGKTKLYDDFHDKLNPRQMKALERMLREGPDEFQGGLSAKNYQIMTGASPSTATRDLNDLVVKKILVQKGELKATRYFLRFLEELKEG